MRQSTGSGSPTAPMSCPHLFSHVKPADRGSCPPPSQPFLFYSAPVLSSLCSVAVASQEKGGFGFPLGEHGMLSRVSLD